MRANRTLFMLGVLCAAVLVARPAQAQDAGRRAERSGGEREGWHEARRREAAERRAALLEWHRARRAGLAAEAGAPAVVAEQRTAVTRTPLARPASLERRTDQRTEPKIVEAVSGVRVLGPVGEHREGAFGHERDRFERGRRGFRGFGHRDLRGWWGGPFGGFGRPYAFEDLVCVARIGDPYGVGAWPYGPYGRADRLELRATCLPSFKWWGAPYGPYGWIADPLLRGYPYGGVPLPVPHRFSHRFFPRGLDLPWAAEGDWLPDEDESTYGYGFEEAFR